MSRRHAWLWIQRVARWVLGGLFVYAGLMKMLGLQASTDWVRATPPIAIQGEAPRAAPISYVVTFKVLGPIAFRDEIKNYRLGPLYGIIHPAAIVLPWIEIVAGLTLVFGIWVAESAAVIIAMLLVFNAGVGAAMYRGLDIECGCFGGDMRVGWTKLMENMGFVALGILVLVGRRRLAAIDRAQAVQSAAPSSGVQARTG